jgi:mono/diheme cytochrome c family protein
MKKYVEHTLVVAATLAVLAVVAAAYVLLGFYDIGADAPHWKPTYAVLATLRDRSIQTRAKNLAPPNLEDPQLILKGAGQYAAMCTGCHLAPGMRDSEIRSGLYPQPPNLAQQSVDPKAAFWAIRHGIKISAMPAWGSGHDDATIWSMVAFLGKLPGMTPAEYRAIVAKAPPDDDMETDGHHGHAEAGRGGMPMPAATPPSTSQPVQ